MHETPQRICDECKLSPIWPWSGVPCDHCGGVFCGDPCFKNHTLGEDEKVCYDCGEPDCDCGRYVREG